MSEAEYLIPLIFFILAIFILAILLFALGWIDKSAAKRVEYHRALWQLERLKEEDAKGWVESMPVRSEGMVRWWKPGPWQEPDKDLFYLLHVQDPTGKKVLSLSARVLLDKPAVVWEPHPDNPFLGRWLYEQQTDPLVMLAYKGALAKEQG